jgi:hypothetical protein
MQVNTEDHKYFLEALAGDDSCLGLLEALSIACRDTAAMLTELEMQMGTDMQDIADRYRMYQRIINVAAAMIRTAEDA